MASARKPTKKAKRNKSPNQAVPQAATKRERGRPFKLVDDDQTVETISQLALIQCTRREAAAFLKVDIDTFSYFLRQNPRCLEAWESGPDRGKVSLRRLQFQSAQKGNTRMLTWLGSNWLGQAHKYDASLSGPGGGPIQTISNEMTPAQAAALYQASLNGGP